MVVAVAIVAPEALVAVARSAMQNPAAVARAAAAMDETGCAGAGLAVGAAAAPVVAKTVLNKNDIILAVVHDGKILVQTKDFMLSHGELVKRFLKEGLPSGATVCTIGKEGNRLVALTSRTFHDKQTHVSEEVYITIQKFFE